MEGKYYDIYFRVDFGVKCDVKIHQHEIERVCQVIESHLLYGITDRY